MGRVLKLSPGISGEAAAKASNNPAEQAKERITTRERLMIVRNFVMDSYKKYYLSGLGKGISYDGTYLFWFLFFKLRSSLAL
tara:strand:- start:55 stop:300 length:246 start_codon:yes stop_codon:yes gene_type:complete